MSKKGKMGLACVCCKDQLLLVLYDGESTSS